VYIATKFMQTVAQLEDSLSEPTDALIATLAHLDGDLLILGAGGKMGPTFARLARRAFDAASNRARVIAVSRFDNKKLAHDLTSHGIEIVRGDLFDTAFIHTIPHIENILYLVGMKFGTAADSARTWASNTFLAGLVADRFRDSRIVALSTGNVYGLVSVDCPSRETDALRPDGEYAMSALGRERVFEHFSRQHGTPTALIRLNYATELRYGVLVDLAQKVFRRKPISLAMGYFNTIWQRDACDMILRSFAHAASPPCVFNITGRERLSVRSICQRLGELLNRTPKFIDTESNTALLSDARVAYKLLCLPQTSLDEMLRWTANWIEHGSETLNKPTHFEVRDGKF
jgi:nucleoside-diphosphate-sugar epimerase